MQVAEPEKHFVELSNEQLQAFKLLFPGIAVHTNKPAADKKVQKPKNRYRIIIEADWKKRYPFS